MENEFSLSLTIKKYDNNIYFWNLWLMIYQNIKVKFGKFSEYSRKFPKIRQKAWTSLYKSNAISLTTGNWVAELVGLYAGY